MTKLLPKEKLMKGIVILLAFLLLAGCGHKEKDAELVRFMDVVISVYTPQDEIFFTFSKAMEDMVDLLKDDGTRIEEATNILTEARDRIEEISVPELSIDADMETYMKKKLLSVEELTGLAKMTSDDRENYLEIFEILLYALESSALNESVSTDLVIQEGEFQIEQQRLLNQYHYYAGNEFFSVLKGDDLDYVRTCLSDNLKLYSIDGVEWQDDADAAFEKQEEIWKQIEALNQP